MGSNRRFRNAAGPSIRKNRTLQGLTQEALAAKLQLAGLNIDRAALSKIEARIRSLYDFELCVIARVLDVPLEQLVPSEKEMKKIVPNLVAGKI